MERERKLKRAQTKASERAGKKTRGDWGRGWNRLGSVAGRERLGDETSVSEQKGVMQFRRFRRFRGSAGCSSAD